MESKIKFISNSLLHTLGALLITSVFIYECIVIFTNMRFMYNDYNVISYKETLINVNNDRAKFPYKTKIDVEYLNKHNVKCSRILEFSEKIDKNKNFIYNNLIKNNKLFVLKGFYDLIDGMMLLLHGILFAISGYILIGLLFFERENTFFDCPDEEYLKYGFGSLRSSYNSRKDIINRCGNCPLCKLEICKTTPLNRENMHYDNVKIYYKYNPPLVKINLYKFLGIKNQKIQEYINDHQDDLYGPYYGMTYKALLKYKKSCNV